MAVINSKVLTTSADFRSKQQAYQKLVVELRENISRAQNPGSDEALQRLKARNKFTTPERIELLIDPGSALLEVGSLAGWEMYDGVPPGAGVTTCIGRIVGRKCMIIANHPVVKGGTYFPISVKKHLRAQEIAAENRLPCIYLVDSGGAFLPLQSEVFPDRFHFGRIFYNQARMSAQGIPQIAVVLGSCTAGGAYVPAMSDESVMVRGNATVFLGGPPLVRAATGVEISAEELGGAEVHCRVSGVGDHLVDNESAALLRTREIVATCVDDGKFTRSFHRLLPETAPESPLYDPSEIGGIVGTDLHQSFDVREVLARLVDGSRLDEFKREYGESIVCGFAHVHGFLVGIVANNGILYSDSALKATHFIELCNQRLTPLVFLQNIVGFMVGKQYEHEGIAKHGAKMVNAVATSRVPKFTVIIGGSYGAGNYAMCGRAYDPRFLFSWPNSRISVMGGSQAAQVLTQVGAAEKGKRSQKGNAKKRGAEAAPSEKLTESAEEIIERYEREGGPYFATARLWDDGIIDPEETRTILALCLATTGYDCEVPYQPGIFRM